ncbi:MAG: hypothetical protein DMG05_13540 [Acidobacteria bacterium]|nr:MAG: hypothetical protein DMG05_13540 [Acidobacteriota bacterium]
MNYKHKNRLLPLLGLALGLMGSAVLAQTKESTPSQTKKVYTNEDLAKYQEKSQPDPASNLHSTGSDKGTENSHATPGEASDIPGQKSKMDKGLDKSYWVGQLKEASDKLDKAKFEEMRFIESLAAFQKRGIEAQTDFQRKTAQWQVEDTTKNLTRAQEQRKKAEAEKAKVLEEAAKKGFKPQDFKNQEASAVEVPK